MDFILNEAEVESKQVKLVFSDDDEEMVDISSTTTTAEDRAFIDDSSRSAEDLSFYRDINNREHYPRFINQTDNPVEVANEKEKEFYGEDDMPEMYAPENREHVDFDLFDKDMAMRFKNSLLCFPNVENHFFYAVIYGIMYDKLKGQNVCLENAKDTIGNDFFQKLKQVENSVMLDHSLIGFFEPCQEINGILSQENYFWDFMSAETSLDFSSEKNFTQKMKWERTFGLRYWKI